ncbi:MAG: hypothetical protein EZS28_005452 [Streblomastix strix]|uniref:Uncharacterized protein n=1 Tax=Streblomastix strix TaxID=222440 RepID=A0A5J4WVP8_9EUKA|nr:MAG: hypothetical protein EZS28_005452 [Streblomastix strix]
MNRDVLQQLRQWQIFIVEFRLIQKLLAIMKIRKSPQDKKELENEAINNQRITAPRVKCRAIHNLKKA